MRGCWTLCPELGASPGGRKPGTVTVARSQADGPCWTVVRPPGCLPCTRDRVGGRGSPGTATPDGQAVPPPPAGTSGPSSWHPVPVSDSRLLSVETCASVCSVCGAGRGGCGGSRPGPAASLRRRLRRRGCPPSPQRGEAAPPFQPVGLPAHPRGRTPRGAEASCCSELGLRLVTSEVVVSADLVCQLPGFSVPFPLSASRAHSRAPSPDSAAGAAGPCGPRAGSCA